MAKRKLSVDDAMESIDAASEAAQTGIASVTALRPQLGVPIREILLEEIVDNPDNPRTTYDEATLDELAASIAEVGVLQPIVIRALTPAEHAAHPNAKYASIAGHRRRRASARAGRSTIPSVERTSAGNGNSPAGAAGDLVLMLTENMQREDLRPLDEARSFKVLADSGLTQMQISKAIGKSQAKISKRLGLLDLDPAVQASIAEGHIAAESAEAFRGTDLAVQRRAAAMLQDQVARNARLATLTTPSGTGNTPDDPTDEPTVPSVVTATGSDVRDCVNRARREQEQEARERAQEEVAEAAGAKILPPKSKYLDWSRQLHHPTEKQLAELAAAGHLGARAMGWLDQPSYYNTDPDFLKNKKAAETRLAERDHARAEHRQQLLADARQALATWAQQYSVRAADAAELLTVAILRGYEHQMDQVYQWLHPLADPNHISDDTIEKWLTSLKHTERSRVALLAVAAQDADTRWEAEPRRRTRERVAEIAPELAEELAAMEEK